MHSHVGAARKQLLRDIKGPCIPQIVRVRFEGQTEQADGAWMGVLKSGANGSERSSDQGRA